MATRRFVQLQMSILVLLAVTVGCGGNAGGAAGSRSQGGPEDSQAPDGSPNTNTGELGQPPEATVMDMLFEGQTFEVEGKKWDIERGEIQNMVVEERKENADGTHTARVTFEMFEDAEAVSIKANVTYRLKILDALDENGKPIGKIASHKVIGVETISAKPLAKKD